MYQGVSQGGSFTKAPRSQGCPLPFLQAQLMVISPSCFISRTKLSEALFPGADSFTREQSGSHVWKHSGYRRAINRTPWFHPSLQEEADVLRWLLMLHTPPWKHSFALSKAPLALQNICVFWIQNIVFFCKKSWSFVCVPSGVQELWLLNSNPRILTIKMPHYWLPAFFFFCCCCCMFVCFSP